MEYIGTPLAEEVSRTPAPASEPSSTHTTPTPAAAVRLSQPSPYTAEALVADLRSASLALLDAAARRISDTVAPCFARRSSSLSGHPPTLPVSTAAYYANPPLSSNVTVRRGGREAREREHAAGLSPAGLMRCMSFMSPNNVTARRRRRYDEPSYTRAPVHERRLSLSSDDLSTCTSRLETRWPRTDLALVRVVRTAWPVYVHVLVLVCPGHCHD
jgi:hypothetical protein